MEMTGDSKSKDAPVRNNRARARTGAAAVARLVRCFVIRLPKSLAGFRAQTFHDLASFAAEEHHEPFPNNRWSAETTTLLDLPEHPRSLFRQIVKKMCLRQGGVVCRAEETGPVGILRVREQRQANGQRRFDAEQLRHHQGAHHVELCEP